MTRPSPSWTGSSTAIQLLAAGARAAGVAQRPCPRVRRRPLSDGCSGYAASGSGFLARTTRDDAGRACPISRKAQQSVRFILLPAERLAGANPEAQRVV